MWTEEKQIPKCFGSVFPHRSIELHPQLDIISPDKSTKQNETGRKYTRKQNIEHFPQWKKISIK